jgi:tetratricopeptide (TPR) repeat protein
MRLLRRPPFSIMVLIGLLTVCPLRGQTVSIDELLEKAGVAQSSAHYADAAALYGHAAALSPSTPELWSNCGVMQYLAGQMDAAVISLKHALRLNPNLFAPLLFLGKTYVQTGRPALALAYLNHAHTLKPNDAEVVLALGKASADLNRRREAASYYTLAVRLAPENSAAWFGLGVTSLEVIGADGRQLAGSQAQSVWARSLYADELLAQGRPLEAVDNYRVALTGASPAQKATLKRSMDWSLSHPDLFPLQPSSQEALQKLAAQLKTEADQSELPPCSASKSSLEVAACAFLTGDYQRSAEQSAKVLEQSPQNAEALYWSIKANERTAVSALSRFEELSPHSAASYVMIGDLYRHQRRPDAAIEEYKKALALDPNDPPALIGTIAADLSAGKLDEAAATGQSALADRPLDPELNLLMAETLAAGNHYDEAKVYLAKCVAGPPELQLRAHYLLGRAASLDGNIQEAIRQFELALPSDTDGSIHYQLSRLYRKSGNIAEAQKTEAEAKVLIQKRDSNAAVAVREATGTNP